MTDYARFNLVVQDENGTVVDGASISVQNEATLAFPQLYSNRTGTAALGNPFTASDGADAGFHVTGGAYKIVATLGAFSRTWRYVAIGTATENDLGALSTLVAAEVVGWYNVKSFGAVGDQVTDDTAAIQDALDTVPAGAALYFPTGGYLVAGSGSASLTRTLGPIHIFGDSSEASVIFINGTPNTRDILQINIPAATTQYGIIIRNMGFLTFASGARYALNVVMGVSPAFSYSNLLISKCTFHNGTGGESLRMDNIAYSQIEKCILFDVLVESGGDNIIFRDNTLQGIECTTVAGAVGPIIEDNVFVGTEHHVKLHNGVFPIIRDNEFETPISVANTYGFLIDLGVTSSCYAALVEGNSISVQTGTSNPVPIRVRGNCEKTVIRDRTHLIQSGSHIQIDSGALDTYVHHGCAFALGGVTGGPIVTDNSGVRTWAEEPVQRIYLSANQTGTDTASAQTWFPGAGATGFTLRANTNYEFEGQLMASKTAGTTSRTIGMLFGGTATGHTIQYACEAVAVDGTVFAGTSTAAFQYVEVATVQTVWGTASTSANQLFCIKVKGRVVVSGAGTFLPQFQYSAAPGGAPTIRRNSFFTIKETR